MSMKPPSLPSILIILFAGLVTPLPSWSQDALVLTHAVVIDGAGGAPVEDGAVVIRGERIEAVGPARSISIPPGARVVDLEGKSLLPGLADMHVHLMGGWDGENVDMLGYQRYLNALLYAGVTTVLDTGNVQPFILQMRQEVAAGRIAGPRIYCAGPLVDGSDPVWPPITTTVSSLAQIPAVVEQLKAAGVDILKGYGGLSIPMVARLAEEGRKVSLPLFVDQWSRNGSVDLVEAGISAFAHTPVRNLGDEVVALMKERDVHIVTTLVVYESFSRRRMKDLSFLDEPIIRETTPPWFLKELTSRPPGEPAELERAFGRLKKAEANAKKLFDAGILLVAGTDAPYPGDFQGEGIHRELELLVEAGLSPLEAITVGTRNAARLMGAEAEWGTVAPGRLANLLMVDGRPDRNIAATKRVWKVVQRGKILDREALRYDPATDPGFRTNASISVPSK
jgi:imidazolonepropionase-like amidohydrolase